VNAPHESHDDDQSRRDAQQADVWVSLGESDPDWGVLTVRGRRHGGWDDRLPEFYASGVKAVQECLAVASPRSHVRALDYGAGTGRLSFALAEVFDQVTAVDISPGMLAAIRSRSAAAGIANITPVVPSDLTPTHDHDFAVSLLVLQHLPNLAAVDNAIGLISGALRPGAPAVIELPEAIRTRRARIQPRFHVYRALRLLGVSHARLHRAGFSGISMLRVRAHEAEALFARNELTVISRAVHPDHDYDYVRWVVRR
jgi:SAM-dependent methyltransferase